MVHGGEGSMVHDGGGERGGPLNFSDDGGRESECSTISVVRLYRHHLFSEKSQ